MSDIAYIASEPEEVSLASTKEPTTVKEYKVDKPELSENIKKYDNRPKVFTEDPFDHNVVSRKKDDGLPSKTASDMIAEPIYNYLGKFLGVDTTKEWDLHYQKVYTIAEWAKKETGTDDIEGLMAWLSDKAKTLPTVGNKKMDDLYLFAKMHFTRNS